MPRPRIDPDYPEAVPFSIKLGVPDAERVIELANAGGQTRSEYLRDLVRQELQRRQDGDGDA